MAQSTTDGYIQLPADSTGKKVDYTELTRDDGIVVERQRVEVYSEMDEVLSTSPIVDGLKQTNELLFEILMELKRKGDLYGS